MASGERRLRLRDGGVEWRVMGQETVVLDLQGSRYFSINATGTLLSPLLSQGRTRARLIEAVTERWDVPEDAAGRDVDGFCAELHAEGLLEG